MNSLSLSSVLLFVLVIPFIMTYRLSPGETPFWLFGIIFALLGTYLVVKNRCLSNILLWLTIGIVIGSAYFSAIIVRHRTAPIYQIHDMPLQLESAIQFFLQGKNPYAVTYFGTPLEQWHYSDTQANPALYHFVMMPWYLLFSLPFYFISISLFGFFDARIPLLFLFSFLLFLAWRLKQKSWEKKHLFLILLAFNPATLGYFLEGRSDIFMYAFLFWGFYLLQKKRLALAGIPMVLAFATKQSAWPIFPFYLVFLWLANQRDIGKTIKCLLPFVLVFSLVVLPFFFWNSRAFLESTVFYLGGSAKNSYPISGYGWGMVLHQLSYPFWIWQLLIGLPTLFALFRWLAKSPSVGRLIFSYALFTLVFWYFSRYFNNSHLGYLSMVFLTSYFFERSENQGSHQRR